MLMQAALRGRFRSQQVQHCQSLLQATTVAVPQMSSNRNSSSLHRPKGISEALATVEPGVRGAKDRLVWRALPYPGSDVTFVGS
jgi:hypothetical protein